MRVEDGMLKRRPLRPTPDLLRPLRPASVPLRPAAAAGPARGGEACAPSRPLPFVAAERFAGVRPGYAFKTGAQGVGYYAEPGVYPRAIAAAAAAAAAATSSLAAVSAMPSGTLEWTPSIWTGGAHAVVDYDVESTRYTRTTRCRTR